MLIAIDIGNTSITVACVHRQRVRNVIYIKTDQQQKLIARHIKKYFSSNKNMWRSSEAVVISSVVPSVVNDIKKTVAKVTSKDVYVIGEDIRVPIANHYKPQKAVGRDRLVCSCAVKQLYGYPAIVIDFGTALTVDVISAAGVYLGGLIRPGIDVGIWSLYAKTALLPRIKLRKPRSMIGQTTSESICSGMYWGNKLLCDGFVDLIKKKFKKKVQIVVTGGYSSLFKKDFIKKGYSVDPFLLIKGIELVWHEQKK